jgi:Putative Actinobacterial Holin-X, holin superfamily III
MSLQNNRSIPELVSDAFGQLAKLVGNEFDLAKAEISDKAAQVGRAVGLIGAGAAIFIPALVVILIGIAFALVRQGFTEPAAFLLTGVVALVVAGILIWIGISRMSGDALKPTATLDQLNKDAVAAKELAR